jgi:hypothetical protein
VIGEATVFALELPKKAGDSLQQRYAKGSLTSVAGLGIVEFQDIASPALDRSPVTVYIMLAGSVEELQLERMRKSIADAAALTSAAASLVMADVTVANFLGGALFLNVTLPSFGSAGLLSAWSAGKFLVLDSMTVLSISGIRPTAAPTLSCESRETCPCPSVNADKCSGHGNCDGKTGICSCTTGWAGKYTGKADNCAQWVLLAWVVGNTTEFSTEPAFVPDGIGLTKCAPGKETACLATSANSTNAKVTVRTAVAPNSEVRCSVKCSPASACGTKDGEGKVVLGPGKRVGTTTVYGVVDYQDDGTEKIFVSIGPCNSTDRRFAINFDSTSSSWGALEDKASRDNNLSSAATLHLLPPALVRSFCFRVVCSLERGLYVSARDFVDVR